MARIFLKRTLTGFMPADADAEEAVRLFKAGQVYRAEVVKPRSYQHHKLIMALLQLTFENQERYANFEHFRKAVAIEAGHVEELVAIDGTIHFLPKSLNYDTLDEVEFTKVGAAMMTVCADILCVAEPELEAEVSRYCDAHYGRAA
jgi:hypothetical protein